MSDIQYPENGKKNVNLKSTDLCGNTRNEAREVNIIQRLLEGQYISILEDGDKATISADVSADYYNKAQINELLGDLDTVKFKVVSALPAVGAENVIYLVPKTAPDVGYEQYIWDSHDAVFYPIGDTDIDLSDYYTKEQSDNRYYTKSEVYQKSETYSQTEADTKFQEKLTASDSSVALSDADKVSKVDPDAKTVTNYPMLSIWNYIKNKFGGTAVSPIDDNTRISGIDFTKADPNQYMTAYDLYAYGIEKIGSEFVSPMTDSTAVADFQPGSATQIKRVSGSTIWNYIKSKLNADTLTSVTDNTKIGSVDKSKTNPVQEFTASVLFQYMWKKIYPVGSIYISVNSTNPATLFGGSWTQIKDRFLLAVGDTYTSANSTGGSSTMTIARANLPNVSISTSSAGKKTFDLDGVKGFTYKSGGETNKWGFDYGTHEMYEKKSYGSSEETASNHSHSFNLNGNVTQTATNNMPPYVTVYVWRRVS